MILVAHRGYPARYPENTLPGIRAALECGARAVEFDVQLTADGVPVLFHDDHLARVTGAAGSILETNFGQLEHIYASEPERLGGEFDRTAVARLDHAAALLAEHPGVEVFVEIKRHSLERFGVRPTVRRIVEQIGAIEAQSIITSFESRALEVARRRGCPRIAWVARTCDDNTRTQAEALEPDFLLFDLKKLPDRDDALWPGPWQWMLYETSDPAAALKWHKRGARYIETDDICPMLESLNHGNTE